VKTSQRTRAEIDRTAIADYLNRLEREQFMAAYVKSAMKRDPKEVLEMVEDYLPLENEALALNESGGRARRLAAWESHTKPKQRKRTR
jgi:hypothetical protein